MILAQNFTGVTGNDDAELLNWELVMQKDANFLSICDAKVFNICSC